MKYIATVLLLLELVTGPAFAGMGKFAVCGPCATGYGCCAERASVADCISCGLCFHGADKKAVVSAFCHKYQPFHKNPYH
jgi:hypothetical protein